MCFTVQLSKFISYLAVSQTALIFYHVVFDLSRTFLTFFQISLKVFLLVFCRFMSFSDATLISYHRFFSMSTVFFKLFSLSGEGGI